MSELNHECGIVAVYQYGQADQCPISSNHTRNQVSRMVPRMLLDIQNRGQLAAGMTTFKPRDKELLLTHKRLGLVSEAFRMSRKNKYQDLMERHSGPAAIGHVRYATCGKDDPNNAQPFERAHLEKRKWFAFGFNGQLANYAELRNEITSGGDFHLARETDTETLMHLISQVLSVRPDIKMRELLSAISIRLDGAYNIAYLNARGDMFVSRDPQGFRPLCYADRDGFFAAASESVALTNLGFDTSGIRDLPPGSAVTIQDGVLRVEEYSRAAVRSHCFFEWIYFANVCSRLDGQSVYLTRKTLGEELAKQETESKENAIVVPVPDTAKAAAEGMAFEMSIPCLEGLMRHRALGRTFIESEDRDAKARMKYIPLPEVLEGKKVFLVDDTIVRSTTMKVLVEQIRTRGKAAEVHVRVACPPIMAPCFYGIDMPDVGDLFAPRFTDGSIELTREMEEEMARHFNADSLRYLPISSISKAVNTDATNLCQACLTGEYPTQAGQRLYDLSLNAQESCSEDGGSRRLVEGTDSPVLPPSTI
ncbi:Amidophosphoribosyltransferase precursor [Thalassoglobus neptunius]|uniref:Amidophosphoribosyltransferase n=1 Tax=Thalassoglobus neptunius TaxID=1938619 RepID=A0A5C5X4F7_9PLAN|nr:amidophosphoribosyltransferase [Thalassoglobus neptunius]TWT57864.1 Amidophosphoribosyltransferase precursor [Thalassoglobus neptunius]